MIVSWDWLKQYVDLAIDADEFARRLMMAGLNHERTERVDEDLAIDLEVTSNRPDCLGHLGIAREAAVLFDRPLRLPTAAATEAGPPVESLAAVEVECPDLCYRYTARVIEGIRVGPSPEWMTRRLEAVGLMPVNNIVDISNYVLMECGQPLHTFDLDRLGGRKIVVRRPRGGESIQAIDHKQYPLAADVCVIADAARPVAIGGVMGGAATEISARTTRVLVEAAEFDPLSIRNTARALNLHSDSSYRFERKIDPEGVDWASRRCCRLILELAGGKLARGSIDVVGRPAPARKPIVLRYSQLRRVLGIDIPPERVAAILAALGLTQGAADAGAATFVAPSWRRDLTREIDLVEEVARIHGYEKIPEDARVSMAASHRTRDDRVLQKVRGALVAAGFDEALTLSAVDESLAAAFPAWTDRPPLASSLPVLRGADRLRTSLLPSLLAVRRANEAAANAEIELFEIAHVYLPGDGGLPREHRHIGLTSGRPYAEVRGAIEALLAALAPASELSAQPYDGPLLDAQQACRLSVGGELLGFLGRLGDDARRQFDLRGPAILAELRFELLAKLAVLTPHYQPLAAYPAVDRDLNLVVDEAVCWGDLAATVRRAAGDCLEALRYLDTYRDEQRLGAGKKSLLFNVALRSQEGTLTGIEADRVRDEIVAACRTGHGAELRA